MVDDILLYRVDDSRVDTSPNSSKQVTLLKVVDSQGAAFWVQLLSSAGEDTTPPKGSRVALIRSAGQYFAVASSDLVTPTTDKGEKKLYALSTDDTPKVLGSVYFKKDGSIVVQSTDGSGNSKIVVTLDASGNATIAASGSGTLTINGSVAPTGSGPFCALPNCLFSGAPHVGNKVTGV